MKRSETRRPMVKYPERDQGLKGRNKRHRIRPFERADSIIFLVYQGRRAPLRFALAPGYHIPRLWRFVKVEAKQL